MTRQLDCYVMAGLLRIHNVSGTENPVVIVERAVVQRKKPVYFHVVNRPIRYRWGSNRTVYIGTTRKGQERIMSSIADRAEDAFDIWGVHQVEVHEIGCNPRQKVKTWRKLERACLLTFREMYGEVPYLNSQGRSMVPDDEFEYFNQDQIRSFIRKWEP